MTTQRINTKEILSALRADEVCRFMGEQGAVVTTRYVYPGWSVRNCFGEDARSIGPRRAWRDLLDARAAGVEVRRRVARLASGEVQICLAAELATGLVHWTHCFRRMPARYADAPLGQWVTA